LEHGPFSCIPVLLRLLWKIGPGRIDDSCKALRLIAGANPITRSARLGVATPALDTTNVASNATSGYRRSPRNYFDWSLDCQSTVPSRFKGNPHGYACFLSVQLRMQKFVFVSWHVALLTYPSVFVLDIASHKEQLKNNQCFYTCIFRKGVKVAMDVFKN